MTGTWQTDWATNDVVTAAEYRKSMGCIFDSTLGSAAATIDITPIPTTYQGLLIEANLRGDTAAVNTSLALRLNGDGGANYDYQQLSAANATLSGVGSVAQTSINLGNIVAATGPATSFDSSYFFLPAYGNAARQKSGLAYAGSKKGTTAPDLRLDLTAFWWRSTAAVTRLTLLLGAGNFDIGSRVTVYVMGS